jgi:hypothetical protein
MEGFCLDSALSDTLVDRCAHALSKANWHMSGELEDFQRSYLAQLPGYLRHVPALVRACFWASLQEIEGRTHSLSLQFSPKDLYGNSYLFKEPIDLEPEQLAVLAPALEGSASIGVWAESGVPHIWGFTPSRWPSDLDAEPMALPYSPFSIRVLDPGEIIVSFVGVRAHITGAKAQFFIQDPLKRFLDADSNWDFQRIANFMRSHRHGGTLLIVSDEKSWTKSIDFQKFAAFPYRSTKTARDSWQVIRDQHKYEAFEMQRQPLKLIAQLTAVDGAAVIGRDFTVLGFGGKIKISKTPRKLEVLVVGPFENGDLKSPCDVSEIGGMRHQSAARFVFQHKGSLGLVASQDGTLSVFQWKPDEGKAKEGIVTVTRPAELLFTDSPW